MGLDVWFSEDVARILAGTREVMRSTLAATSSHDHAEAEAYRRGFDDAIRAASIAFGVAIPSTIGSNDHKGQVHFVNCQLLPDEQHDIGRWTVYER